MTLGDDTIVKGATMEEAFQTVAKMKVDTANYAREQKQKNDELAAENQRLQQEIAQRQQTIQQAATPQQYGFSDEEYYEKLNSSPLEATKYALSALFGVQDPVAAINSMREESWATVQQNVTAAFIATHPEFNPADSTALSGRVQACLQYGMPFNAQTLDYAYQGLKHEGLANPIELEPAEPEPAPNPSLTGSSGVNSVVDPETLNDADLRQYMRSRGMNV
jgi:hypothetical protein